MVCLHGQPGSATDWAAVGRALRSEFTVVAVDRLGYGRTGGEGAGFEANAEAVIASLDDLGIDQAIMVGHSWAGGVGVVLAADHRSRVRGLVLVASIGPNDGAGWVDRLLATPVVGDVMVASTFAMARTLLGSGAIRAGLDRVLPGLSSTARATMAGGAALQSAPDREQPAVKVPAPAQDAPWRTFMIEQRAYVDEVDGLVPRLARISVPTEIVTGLLDRVVAPEVGARLASAIPSALLREVPDAGHLLPFDHPNEVAEAVRSIAGRHGLRPRK
ncbi:MAG: alpha/beta hydrolase [Actinomycetota bacterium]|nr:alpha/beta hydrolase [Actinomycetota bacterium]